MARKKIIPKRIGSVKIPKKLRRFGDQVLADPRAREVAASALLALGTALASRGAPKGSALRDIFDHPAEAAKSAEKAGAEAASKLGETASGVAAVVAQVVGGVVEAVRRDFAPKPSPERPDASPRPGRDDEEEEDRVH